MRIERITELHRDHAAQMVRLMDLIEDAELDKNAVLSKILHALDRTCLIGLFDGEELKGFVYFTGPNTWYPKRGYLNLTAIDATVPQKYSRMAYDMGCQWLIERGATYVWGWTKRSPRAIKRLYGFEAAKERQVVFPLVGDDHLKVERDKGCAQCISE